MLVHKKIEILTELGLTSLQAKVYLAFLDTGETTASIASRISGVARQEVYRIISELLQMGLLKKIIDSPSRYEAVPFEIAITQSIRESRIKLLRLEEASEEIFRNRPKKDLPHLSEFKFLQMKENDKWFRAVNVFAGLKTHDLINSCRRYSQVLFSSDDVEEALKGGTLMRVIINKPEKSNALIRKIKNLKRYPNFRIRFIEDEPKAFFSVRDQKEVYLILKPNRPKGPPYLISNHPTMVELAQKYFDDEWRGAIEYTSP